MAKDLRFFSMRSLFFMSVALNVSLILKVMYNSEKENLDAFSLHNRKESFLLGVRSQVEAHVSQWPRYSSAQRSYSSSKVVSSGDRVQASGDVIINLDHGDPTMYEKYWRQLGDKTTIVIPGWQSLSYFSDTSNLCWFLEPEFAKEIERLHKVVGNAVTEDRYIVVGTGSTQLYQAALYALSPQDSPEPTYVVSAAPFYSSYPSITDCVKSGLYKWGGDARNFNKEGLYIELVTSPNNPDGYSRQPVVNRSDGILVHDLAYYWPQYAPITSPADHDIMLFTVSKTTGHAGMRIGWALVKDKAVAKKMTEYIMLSTIGVSKDSQLRAAKVLKAVSDSCEQSDSEGQSFFAYSYYSMVARWKLLRQAVKQSGLFSLPDFSPQFCQFLGLEFEPQPAFAWLKCEGEITDCESFLRDNKILTRSGKHFGSSMNYVRISMLDRDENYNLFVDRLSTIQNASA